MNGAQQFDALVVGGGPAGATAAHELSRGGLRVALVDRHTFPRDKLCGGLLTLRSKKVYESVYQQPWDPIVEHVSQGVSFYHRDTFLNGVDDYKPLYFTCRRTFDDFLLRQAEAQGTELILGDGVRRIDGAAGRIELKGGRQLKARFVIGADGVNSAVARSLFGLAIDPATIAFCLEMDMPIADSRRRPERPEIFFGFNHWGYAWLFPKRDLLTLGIGGLQQRNADIKSQFSDFLQTRLGFVPPYRVKGHHIPAGDYRKQPGRGDVLLCGDAAGLVEPITGEGIAFAMQSGQMAAHSALEAVRSGRPALNHYLPRYRRISRMLWVGNMLKQLIFHRRMEPVFLSRLPLAAGLVRKHVDLMSDDLSYPRYAGYILRRNLGHALKLLARP